MEEKRRFSRIPFAAATLLASKNTHWQCRLVDISVKGVLLEIPQDCTLARDQTVDFELKLNDSDAVIKMSLRLAHTDNNRAGFYCEVIDADSMTHLRRLVELNLGDPNAFSRELRQLGNVNEPHVAG